MKLKKILGHLKPKIDHIGSTAVPNLSSKPIIDVLVGLKKMDINKSIKPMIKNKYIYYEAYNSLMPNRRLFVGLKDNKFYRNFNKIYSKDYSIPHKKINFYKLTHIHIWPFNSKDWIRHIAFRDYMISNPKIAMQYKKLKEELSFKDWSDGNHYNAAKESFIKKIESDALSWYNKNI